MQSNIYLVDKLRPNYFVMNMNVTFGEYIRIKRKELNLPIRKVAAILDIDPSTLSKIERGERSVVRLFIPKLASLFNVQENHLLIFYHSDKIAFSLINEDCSGEILKVAKEKINYLRSKNYIQSKIEFKEKHT